MRGVRFVYQFRSGIEMHLTDGSAVLRDRAVSVGIFLKLQAQISPDGAAEMLRQVRWMYFLFCNSGFANRLQKSGFWKRRAFPGGAVMTMPQNLQEPIDSGESGLPAKPAACIAYCQNGLLILEVRKI